MTNALFKVADVLAAVYIVTLTLLVLLWKRATTGLPHSLSILIKYLKNS